ncbi:MULTISPECIES: MIP/aquaporin family protein [unclassified Pseudactinotalea]|uniref:MIP/aquaporin family protein n=1 Tax=unclassified Pseudactinotalea TaxID=2649176 RepID=UPI00128AF0E8|nr:MULTISPECIES: MIP/aquaporin family protein [unclassified Pseudactinotalea]MPV50443.1 aquaporin family protein [Pseudactinotalea sp. HY160]QGH70531.1 aquaporin family protein [Pseudactinotalea sp. HY158]
MFTDIFVPELIGTMILILLGCGVVANYVLVGSKGTALGGGFLAINLGWGFGVTFGIYAATNSGAHLNPAVTLGFLVADDSLGMAEGMTFAKVLVYFAGQFAGAMIGAFIVWLTYKMHFDEEENKLLKLAPFSTIAEREHLGWNLIPEIVGTFVLVFSIISLKTQPAGALAPLIVGFIVLAIGLSLGGPTGYAINPARDLGPRVIHALVPIKNKGTSNFRYGLTVPIIGPVIGGILGGVLAAPLIPMLPL